MPSNATGSNPIPRGRGPQPVGDAVGDAGWDEVCAASDEAGASAGTDGRDGAPSPVGLPGVGPWVGTGAGTVGVGLGAGGAGLCVATGGRLGTEALGAGSPVGEAAAPVGAGVAGGRAGVVGATVRGRAVGATGAAGARREPEDIRSAGPPGSTGPPTGRTKSGSTWVIRRLVRPPGWSATTPPTVHRPRHATAATWSALARVDVDPPRRNPCMGRS